MLTSSTIRTALSGVVTGIEAAAGKTITNVAAADGVVTVTATGHGFSTGDFVAQSGIEGAVEANGPFQITKVDANSYTLDGLEDVTAYTQNGVAQKLTVTVSGLLKDMTASQVRDVLEYLDKVPSPSVPGSAAGLGTEPTLGERFSVA